MLPGSVLRSCIHAGGKDRSISSTVVGDEVEDEGDDFGELLWGEQGGGERIDSSSIAASCNKSFFVSILLVDLVRLCLPEEGGWRGSDEVNDDDGKEGLSPSQQEECVSIT